MIFFNDFLMGSKGFGKVPASKWCKMQQNQWFSLVFQGFTKQNDGIPAVLASFGRFWQEPRWKSKKNHKFLYNFFFKNDF